MPRNVHSISSLGLEVHMKMVHYKEIMRSLSPGCNKATGNAWLDLRVYTLMSLLVRISCDCSVHMLWTHLLFHVPMHTILIMDLLCHLLALKLQYKD